MAAFKITRSDRNEIAILKFYASGQPLHYGWNGNQWMDNRFAAGRRNFYQGETANDSNRGVHYKSMHLFFQKGIASLKRQGTSVRIAGFAWMQGEQDSKHTISANAYAVSLKRLKTQDRRGF